MDRLLVALDYQRDDGLSSQGEMHLVKFTRVPCIGEVIVIEPDGDRPVEWLVTGVKHMTTPLSGQAKRETVAVIDVRKLM